MLKNVQKISQFHDSNEAFYNLSGGTYEEK